MEINWGVPVVVNYTNWKGKTSVRKIIPESLTWGATPFHPTAQWLLTAYDEDKKEYRDFALKDMYL